eukprot:scaffold188208_cov32-Tisochrysis_lutea.AAC.1
MTYPRHSVVEASSSPFWSVSSGELEKRALSSVPCSRVAISVSVSAQVAPMENKGKSGGLPSSSSAMSCFSVLPRIADFATDHILPAAC